MILPELRLGFAVYGYMNGLIFKIFGAAILGFELFLVIVYCLGLPRIARNGALLEGLPIFFGFLLISTLIAIGLICLQRWAAVTASVVGFVWSLVFASSLGYAPWRTCLVGGPVVFGMLLPLYATVRYWSSLNPVSYVGLKPFFHALRSSDQFHLE